jgi:hypothetical protein
MCSYATYYQEYIYAGITGTSGTYGSVVSAMILKLNRNDGSLVYLRKLPQDAVPATNYPPIFMIYPGLPLGTLVIY